MFFVRLATPTYTFLQQIPLRLWIVKETTLQIDADLAQKIVAAEHIRMPNSQP